MARTMSMALAGLGTASPEIIEEIVQHPNLELAAACDVRPEARAAFERAYGLPTFETVADMAAAPAVDAVYVATPSHLHCEHVLACAAHGKDVIVEKPVALSLDECDKMIAASDAAEVRILAGHTHSFDAPVQKMAELVSSGVLGTPYMLNHWYFTDWMYRGRMPEELDEERGGGVVFRQGPHSVDILRLVMQSDVVSVHARAMALEESRPGHGAFVAYLELASGAVATLVFNGYAHFDSSELTWGIGEGGYRRNPRTHLAARARIGGLSGLGEEAGYKDSMRFGGAKVGEWLADDHAAESPRTHGFYGLTVVSGTAGDMRQTPSGVIVYGSREWHAEDVPLAAMPRQAELNVLYNAWSSGEPLHSHDMRWARETLAVCLAIIESSRTGATVALRDFPPKP